jgi:hypothetical protein
MEREKSRRLRMIKLIDEVEEEEEEMKEETNDSRVSDEDAIMRRLIYSRKLHDNSQNMTNK